LEALVTNSLYGEILRNSKSLNHIFSEIKRKVDNDLYLASGTNNSEAKALKDNIFALKQKLILSLGDQCIPAVTSFVNLGIADVKMKNNLINAHKKADSANNNEDLDDSGKIIHDIAMNVQQAIRAATSVVRGEYLGGDDADSASNHSG
jgi:hypothetical protein